jgi:hypothetical protein
MLPKNIKIKYHVVADQINEEELLKRISKNIPEVRRGFSRLSHKQMQELLKYSERNIRWDILEKDKKLSRKKRNEIVLEGKIIHDALLKGGWNNDLYYLFNDNAIPIIHRKSNSGFLHIATCSGAYVQFWVGVGILRIIKGKYIPAILSFEQYRKVKKRLKKIKYEGIDMRNFKNIEVLYE